MPRRAERTPDQLRAHLLDCAELILVEEGTEALTARRIAKLARCAPGMLYVAFSSLDELINQLNVRTLEQLHIELKAAAIVTPELGSPDPEVACAIQVLQRLARQYLIYALRSPARWRLVFEHAGVEADALPADLESRVMALFALVERELKRIVPNLDSAQISRSARGLWGGVHGICILHLTNKISEQGAGPIPNLLDDLIANYVHGLRGPTPVSD